MRAQRIASRLLVELCGAELVPGTIDVAAAIPAEQQIRLRGERVEGLLGMRIEQPDQVAYLERLGFTVEVDGVDLVVDVPPDRHYDVTREADLIEEVARVHGIDQHLPSTLPGSTGQAGALRRDQRLRRRAEDALRDLGFDEIVGWSFTDPGEAERLRIPAEDPRAEGITISNPLSEDQSVMRTNLLGSLLDAAQRNLARDAEQAALFESGRIYLNHPPTGLKERSDLSFRPVGPMGGEFAGEREAPFVEPHRLGALAVGPLTPRSWKGGGDAADFFALKGVLEGLAARLGAAIAFEPAGEPFLHPGRGAKVLVDDAAAGWVGELHPLVCRGWDLDSAVGFEADLSALVDAASAGDETFEDVTAFPAVRQDLAVVVPDDVPAARVRGAVLSGGGELLRAAEVFDLYAGEQLGEGRKSLALRLEFRAPDRTLTDEEVAALRDSIAAELDRIGGSLRE
jgi:phenylalanyl-tRNA synthetase beta chain